MRDSIVAAETALAETPLPLTPALARADAMRLPLLASPRERGCKRRYSGVNARPSHAAARRSFFGFGSMRSFFWLGIQSMDVRKTRPFGETLQ
jgi:hypothetical protein